VGFSLRAYEQAAKFRVQPKGRTTEGMSLLIIYSCLFLSSCLYCFLLFLQNSSLITYH